MLRYIENIDISVSNYRICCTASSSLRRIWPTLHCY